MAKENEKGKDKEKEKAKEAKQEEAKEKDKKAKEAKEDSKKSEKPKDTKDSKDTKEGKEGKEGENAPVSKAAALKNLFSKGIAGISVVVLALAALNIILMGVAVYYIYYIKFVYQRPVITEKATKEEIEKKKDSASEVIEYKMDPFTINLSKAKGKRYVNAKFVLIALNWETRDELDKKIDKIRDAVIKILDDKYPEELITVQGKLFLKDQIVTEVNRILTKGSIKEVFIESFLIQ